MFNQLTNQEIVKYLDEIKGMNIGNRAEKALSAEDFERLNILEYKLTQHRDVKEYFDRKTEGLGEFMTDVVKIMNQRKINQALYHIPLDKKEVREQMRGVRKAIAKFNKEEKQERKKESKQSWRQNNRDKISQLKSLIKQAKDRDQSTTHLEQELKIREQYNTAPQNTKNDKKEKKHLQRDLRTLPRGSNDIKLLQKRQANQDKFYQKAKEHLQPLIQKKQREKSLEMEY